MANADHYLSITARHNKHATVFQFSRDLYAVTGSWVSKVTVSSRLHERGLFTRRPAICASLTSANRRVCLAWCKDHRDWCRATILFTDESRFSLTTDSHPTFIWREPGTRYLYFNVQEIDRYGSRSLMVWPGIMLTVAWTPMSLKRAL